MTTVTFDTNVLLSATLWDGSVSQKVLFDCIQRDVTIYSSSEIIAEYKKVLKRDFDFTDEEIGELLEKTMAFLKLIEPSEKVDIVKNDPDDNKIIECAIASRSRCIITYDKELLKIKEYQGIKIITPEESRGKYL
ncbi:MAG: putative toxin-antitoxin system toxin component, PIN family [Candidatus Woesearchaeota archaeon]|nr:putative toxin-antitoxin system toxin component, PIN family [Candidatus Woesearchaeota archaeon]